MRRQLEMTRIYDSNPGPLDVLGGDLPYDWAGLCGISLMAVGWAGSGNALMMSSVSRCRSAGCGRSGAS